MPPTPQVDYFIGRPVADVESYGDTGWQLIFDGGSKIVVENENYPRPDTTIIGNSLTSVEFDDENVILCFGKTPRNPDDDANPCAIRMTIQMLTYGIADEAYTGGQVVYPARVVDDPQTPPDPSDDRAREPE